MSAEALPPGPAQPAAPAAPPAAPKPAPAVPTPSDDDQHNFHRRQPEIPAATVVAPPAPAAEKPVPVVLSRRQEEDFTPPHYDGADRKPRPGAPVYRLAPLTLRQRNAIVEGMVRQGIRAPKWAVRAKAIARAFERTGRMEEAAQARAILEKFRSSSAVGGDILDLAMLEEEAATDPDLAAMLADAERARTEETIRYAQAALRGWSNLPFEFSRDAQGRATEAALDAMPPADLDAVGQRAYALAHMGEQAGNS